MSVMTSKDSMLYSVIPERSVEPAEMIVKVLHIGVNSARLGDIANMTNETGCTVYHLIITLFLFWYNSRHSRRCAVQAITSI